MHSLSLDVLFQHLLHYRNTNGDRSCLGSWLSHQITRCSFPDLAHFPFEGAAYTRTCIAREPVMPTEQFEALIMRWDKQVKTKIHGHPAFSFYYVIAGIFQMEMFSNTPAHGLQLTESRLFFQADSTWHIGQVGHYDNFIHRVTCLEPGLTFHVYSDDAQKGVAFESVKAVGSLNLSDV